MSTDIQQIGLTYPEYLSDVEKNYRWNFAAIALDAAFFSFALGMLSQDTILPYFVAQLTGSRFLVGVIPALYYLGLFFPQLLGAFLAQGRPTRKWTIFWIAAAERIGILFIALIAQFLGLLGERQALLLLFAAYALFTTTNGLIGPAYGDFISKNIIRHRGFFYGITFGLGNLLGFGAGLLATYLLDHFAFPRNLQLLFWTGFASSFISPFLIASFREVPFPGALPTESIGQFLRAVPGHVRAAPDFQRYMVTRSVLGLGIIGNAFYALYALERFELSEGYLGLFTLIILLSQSLLALLWGWLGDRFGFKLVFVLAAGLIAVAGATALLAPEARLFYGIAVAIGGIYAAIRTSDANMVFELAPPAETSRFIGISNTVVAPTMTLAALMGGLVVDLLSYRVLFALVLAIGLLSTFLTLRFMPDPRQQPAATP